MNKEKDMPREAHSRYGAFSFTLSILSGIAYLITIVTALAIDESSTRGISDSSFETIILIVLILLTTQLISLSLGIVGIFQKGSPKLLPILGTTLSAAIFTLSLFALLFL